MQAGGSAEVAPCHDAVAGDNRALPKTDLLQITARVTGWPKLIRASVESSSLAFPPTNSTDYPAFWDRSANSFLLTLSLVQHYYHKLSSITIVPYDEDPSLLCTLQVDSVRTTYIWRQSLDMHAGHELTQHDELIADLGHISLGWVKLL